MSKAVPVGSTGFILAAGLGKRMRPLSLMRPKPLIPVNGQRLIDYAVNALTVAGTQKIIVNTHYLSDQIKAWSATVHSPRIIISDESDMLLDTGGGVANALPLIGNDAFFVLNSDGFWLERKVPALTQLASAWDDRKMDCLLLLAPLARTFGYEGRGDFHRNDAGQLSRIQGDQCPRYAYIGAYVVHPRLFSHASTKVFSMNFLWDRAIAEGRLYGFVHDHLWLHVGTPEAIDETERILAEQ